MEYLPRLIIIFPLFIVKYLSSKRPFANSFNQYLADILFTVSEQSTQIRTKALKCMTMIVTEDPDVLLKDSMQQAVQYSLKDVSTMVREAAVDLIGKYYMPAYYLLLMKFGFTKFLLMYIFIISTKLFVFFQDASSFTNKN